MSVQNVINARIYCVTPPLDAQKEKILAFLRTKYGADVNLEVVIDSSVVGGFRLEAGDEVYDWSLHGRAEQLRKSMTERENAPDYASMLTVLRSDVNAFQLAAAGSETGVVIAAGDGIAIIQGLENVSYGEVVVFESGVKGMARELLPDRTGCILFGGDEGVRQGDKAASTGKTAGIPVGEEFLGRVVDALGEPLDGRGRISAVSYRPAEMPAPGIIDRRPVTVPLETGYTVVDALFPIGRGQRELIIGDRQTGKTSLTIDTIINQRGKNVICVYVAVGQKASSVARTVKLLHESGAMEYTAVICASAGDSAPMQYIAPYTGCSLAEYFMYKGKDVLIVYDDLSKHAVAYRALSLLLGRSPGREAYPGDVFYLHSRLLERSARLSAEKGGGSITALPIVETQADDVSAYIPTNVISITDGQIFLESGLFYSGQRPAVNIGLSVSRVGGAAQTKAMKKAVGALRLELAQYREMEVFTQFSSDLDELTKDQLLYGAALMKLLRQSRDRPLALHEQVIMLTAAMKKLFNAVDQEKLIACRDEMLQYFNTAQKGVCLSIDASGTLSDEQRELIISEAKQFIDSFAARPEEK